MPRKQLSVCAVPGCTELAYESRCSAHRSAVRRSSDAKRETSSARGYGARWARRRRRFLHLFPVCVLCGDPSEVPDHWPATRRELVRLGDPDPDSDHHLRALCIRCHNRETARAKHNPRPA